jgi:(p)ppGpp synthase/HD superfamily hydrolase
VAAHFPHDDIKYTVAMLHDTIEDTGATYEDLIRWGFSETICDAVLVLTRNHDENYKDYVRRVALDPIAKDVKLADLDHNMGRGDSIPGGMPQKLKERYEWALEYLINGKE